MKDESTHFGGPVGDATNTASLSAAVDRATFQAALDALRAREKAHTREGDAIAAVRRRLPMVEVDADLTLIGPHGPLTLLDAFEGRRQLIAYYFMWHTDHPAAEQCEGCTWVTTQVAELSYLHSPRHHLCRLLSGSLRRKQPLPRLHGLAHSVVLRPRLARRAPGRATSRHDAHRVLPPGGRPRLRNLLDDHPRRGGHGLQLRAHGPHRVRTPRGVGGLASGLATTMHLHTHGQWLAHLATNVAGRTPSRPVVATRSWTIRRPESRPSLRSVRYRAVAEDADASVQRHTERPNSVCT